MSNISSIKQSLLNAAEELKNDNLSQMSEEDKKLHALAQKLLLLERDLKASGLSQTEESRVARILEALERESL